ncbi:hypothetical protein [Flavobacterium sp. CAU 1735]|uniref:hypothetical protein n=1 Tax=Flavobacterium sp. CAU 1735 TaxID=3140361 RepID=UPI003260A2CA
MNCLLLGGNENVGKTETIIRLHKYLANFINAAPQPQQQHKTLQGVPINDYMWILEGQNKENKNIRIIINTAADDKNSIMSFKNFFDKNFGLAGYDILISAVRDKDTEESPSKRHLFFNTMNINPFFNFILEIPFGKVRKGKKSPIAKKWYADQIDNLIHHTLANPPFNI